MQSYTDNTSMIHRAALKIAGKGKPVFPCKPDKAPHTPNGFKDATTDPAKVTALWTRYRSEKIGTPTGSRSDFFVFDVDRLEALEELGHEMPNTLTIKTPRGGLHYCFRHVPGLTNSAGSLPQGIDIRGEGGYVIVPPSTGYTVVNRAPVADVPEWLLEALRDEPRISSESGRPRSRRAIPDEGEPIHEGGRDETLTRLAGRLHDGTRSLPQLEDDLQAVNQTRCIPPLPSEQVRKIAHSVSRYEPCRPARRDASQDPETSVALAEVERIILGREWKGKGGKTRYSLCVAWLKMARRHAMREEGSLKLQVSWRELALAAGVSRVTAMKNVKDMNDLFRVDSEGAESGKSGSIAFLLPPARIYTTLPTGRVVKGERGGCIDSRAPFTAPRLRWSSPRRRQIRGRTPGTYKVRDSVISRRRAAIQRLGKGCELSVDSLEVARGGMRLAELADAVGVKRPRDLVRRKNLETGKGRDGYVTRLVDAGVAVLDGDTVYLAEDWLEALDRERDRSGEIELYKRDMAQYNRERDGYGNRHNVKPAPAPTDEELREVRESYPRRRREAIEAAIARLFKDHPEYRGRRVGQIACRLVDYLPADFPRGPSGVPKDFEVEAVLDGECAA